MAKWNLDFYTGETGYSDGSIELELLEIVKNTDDFTNVLENDDRWPILYHLDPMRQNILKWYEFKKSSTLLEIGSGCGALTSLFCERVNQVTSVELTKIRSEINYNRNLKYDNLEIITGNFSDIEFQEEYDYIVLNGVLEYAGSFTKGMNPYRNFLSQILKLLKKDGIILIAIENRMGLKYLNGAPEDHTGKLFSGINGYNDVDGIQTFSKNELEALLQSLGLSNRNIYYPFPDYKLADEIYTDEAFGIYNSSKREANFNATRLSIFDEANAKKTFAEDGLMPYFSNSFLIEASFEPIEREKEMVYYKSGSQRLAPFSLETLIQKQNQELVVVKKANSELGEPFLEKLYNNQKHSDIYPRVPCELSDDECHIPYIVGKSLATYLEESLSCGDFESIEKEFDILHNKLFQGSILTDSYNTDQFQQIFGSVDLVQELHCKKNTNIDLIFSNIIIDKDGNRNIIDYEWELPFLIPQEFIFWRSIYYFYLENSTMRKAFPFTYFLEKYSITKELMDEFLRWDHAFSYDYTNKKYYRYYEKGNIQIREYLNAYLVTHQMMSVLFVEFEEAEKTIVINGNINKKDDELEVEFIIPQISEPIRSLRWDPCEYSCGIEIKKVIVENKREYKAIPVNHALARRSIAYFTSNDPFYALKGDYTSLSNIKIIWKTHDIDIPALFEDLKLEQSEHERLKKQYITLTNDFKSKVKNLFGKF